MHTKSVFILFLSAFLLARPSSQTLAAESDEQRLIEVLSSNASLAEKDAACEKLKTLGNARSVPALASLLTDKDLSHSARYALEAIPAPEAESVLIEALGKTSGLTQAGIASTLGIRGDKRAVPALVRLLSSSDDTVACAAARALGQIGEPESIKPLRALAGKANSSSTRAAAIDGLLSSGRHLELIGKDSRAVRLYEQLYNDQKDEGIQTAAFAGMIRASGPHGARLMLRAISGPESAAQIAALQAAHEVPGRDVTVALATSLDNLKVPQQIAVLQALYQRNDPAAAPYLQQLASKGPPAIRADVLKALGRTGDASTVPVLSQFAASGTPAEQAAAREALVILHRGAVAEMLVNQLPTAGPEVQAELARALGDRGDRSAAARLFHLAETGSASVRKASLKALGLLIDDPEVPALVRYIALSKDQEARQEGSEALNNACQRITSKHGTMNVEPIVKGIVLGKRDARIALLPICSGLVSPQIRIAIRSGVNDPDPEVHATGVRALCDTSDPDLLEDIIALARTTKDDRFRALAINAGVRLTQEENRAISKGQRVAALKSLLSAATRPEEKRVVIAGLAEIPDSDALRILDAFMDDPGLHVEAARASVKVATALPGMYAKQSMAVLQKGLGAADDDATRQVLENALKQLQDSIDYITDWMVAGPYQQQGKDYAALFDIVFPPETESAKGVDWKPLAPGADPKRPFVMDLFKALGGQQCVGYARTWIHTEKDRPLRLELGSDDGIKVWVNDKQVYALNTARALTPGSDNVDLTLRAGWNMLLLKVTQNTLGWEFCAKLVNPDGTHCEELQIESAPKTTSASSQ